MKQIFPRPLPRSRHDVARGLHVAGRIAAAVIPLEDLPRP